MKAPLALLFSLVCVGAHAQLGAVRVDVTGAKSQAEIDARMDQAARSFSKVATNLTSGVRAMRRRANPLLRPGFQFSLPMKLVLTKNGRDLARPFVTVRPLPSPNALTIAFDSSGSRAFPSTGYFTPQGSSTAESYGQFLNQVFTTVQPTLDAIFGHPSANYTVFVRNYDADIADRDAVAGGYFVPNNGSGQAEIRFPIYNQPETAAVNFVHCLLLAYLGSDSYQWDAFQEGLLRAATMKIVRTAGALPAGLDSGLISQVLDNTYDVSGAYDWYNQRALGGPVFIAPNLRNTQLPAGGSVGGLYLLRYQMAGTAWEKVLVEYPGFASLFNALLYATPSSGSNLSALLANGQSTLNSLAGSGAATIEGQSFATWFGHQFALETAPTYGTKLLVEPSAITSGLASPDFGVFSIATHYFSNSATTGETLLTGNCYPIFWDVDFNRVFPSTQDDQFSIAGGYGSVTPNFPDLFSGQPYRVSVEIPVDDQTARVHLPAGSIATASSASVSDFYGTVENAIGGAGDTTLVGLVIGNGAKTYFTVTNGAFGALIGSSNFLAATQLTVTVELAHASGTKTVLLSRVVDKGPGPIGLDLDVAGESTLSLNIPAGVSMIPLNGAPLLSDPAAILGQTSSSLLLARYNPTNLSYSLYPDLEALTIGHGYFYRTNSSQTLSVPARATQNTPVSVALKPGWNMISVPFAATVPTNHVELVRAANAPISFAAATVTNGDLNSLFFEFVQGAANAGSGVPETGAMQAATQFESGKAYFIKCNDPEGASLLFFPQNAAPFIRAPEPSPQNLGGWAVKMVLSDGVLRPTCSVGATSLSNGAFSPVYDAEAAPLFGSLRIASDHTRILAQDLRSAQTAQETFQIRMEGLIPGQRYTVRLLKERGSPTRLYCSTLSQWINLGVDVPFIATQGAQTWTFIARRNGR